MSLLVDNDNSSEEEEEHTCSAKKPKLVASNKITLYQMDAVEGMSDTVKNGSVSLCICDPPYNIGVKGGNKWDILADYMRFAKTWLVQIERSLKPGGALLLYGSPCRDWISRMVVFAVDELNVEFVQDMP